nr:reverse transcriptase domain-containing protein [Tanacetum cinerariifolium]
MYTRSSKNHEVSHHSESRTSNVIREQGRNRRSRRSYSLSVSPGPTASAASMAAAIRTLTQTGITTKERPPEGQRISPRVRTLEGDTGSPNPRGKDQALKTRIYRNHGRAKRKTLSPYGYSGIVKGCLSKGNIIKNFYHGFNETNHEVLNFTAGGIFLYKNLNQAYQLLEDKVLLKLDWAKNHKSKPNLKRTIAFATEGPSKSDTGKIMDRMDAMTIKMDAQYKELKNLNLNEQPNKPETTVNFDSDDEDEEPPPQPKTPKSIEETPLPKPYKPKIPYPQRLRKEKMEAQYEKFLDMICAVRINVPLIDVLAALLSDESSAMIQNKVPPKLGDPGSFLIPCNFNQTFSCNALADLGASINLMPYTLYAKLSIKALKPTRMSVRLADRSGKSYDPPVNLNEQPNKPETTVNFDSDDEDEEPPPQPKTPKSIEETPLPKPYKPKIPYPQRLRKEKMEAQYEKFLDMICAVRINVPLIDVLAEVGKFTFLADFVILEMEEDSKVKTSLEEPPMDLELKPLPENLEYVFLEEPSLLSMIISSQLSKKNKDKLILKIKRKRPLLALLEHTLIESVEVFMDDFSVFENSFDNCLNSLDKMLQRCKDAHLVLKWEKCHFKVKEGTEQDPLDKTRDKKGAKNVATDHLSRIDNDETSDESDIDDNFHKETLLEITTKNEPWFTEFANYLVGDIIPKGMAYQQKNKFFSDLKSYFKEEPYLFRICADDGSKDSLEKDMYLNEEFGSILLVINEAFNEET